MISRMTSGGESYESGSASPSPEASSPRREAAAKSGRSENPLAPLLSHLAHLRESLRTLAAVKRHALAPPK